MIIIKQFVRSFLLASGAFLAISICAVAGLMYASYRLSLESNGSAEVDNVATIIAHNYGVGDLVAMRATLDSIAIGRNWTLAHFADTDGTVHWNISDHTRAQEYESPLDSSDLLISKADVVNPSTGQKLGTFQIAKRVDRERQILIRELAVVISFFLVFWISFLCIIWWRAKQAFIPMTNMADSVRAHASELALDLRSNPKDDELTQIAGWFQQLGEEWRTAQQRALENERLAAVARTTTMLAHDVRRPFSILKIGLDRLMATGDNPATVRSLAQKIRDHVGKAFDQVNGLITDLMEISGEQTNLQQGTVEVQSLTANVLLQLFSHDDSSRINFSYDFKHSGSLHVDEFKCQRVFTNIMDNARQAMQGTGEIWVRTRNASEHSHMIEIAIGNNGPVIAQGDLDNLFKAFFTKGKRGGTGLGLAICQKIVTAHGGTVFCRSSRELGTEFVMTLPKSTSNSSDLAVSLPQKSIDIRATFLTSPAHPSLQESAAQDLTDLRKKICEYVSEIQRPIKVLIVEDESVYAEGIKGMLHGFPELSAQIEITSVSSAPLAIRAASNETFDLVITDIDLGSSSMSGFDLVRLFRKSNKHIKICIHSNRSLPADYRAAVECGADSLLPKPMSNAHLLALLLPHPSIKPSSSLTHQLTTQENLVSNRIIVLDDDPFILEAWLGVLKGHNLMTFSRPADLFAAIEQGSLNAKEVDTFITDFHFDNDTDMTGLDVARQLLAKGARRVIAATDELSARSAVEFATVISKDEITMSLDLQRILG